MSGLVKCVRCGEDYFGVIEADLDECDACGEFAVLDFQSAADILNEIYCQTGDGLSFDEWIRTINREELFNAN